MPLKILPAVLLLLVVTSLPANGEDVREKLKHALSSGNLEEIRDAVNQAQAWLGTKVGVPEVADEYLPVPAEAPPLTTDEIKKASQLLLRQIRSKQFWRIGTDPTQMQAPLRAPASVISASIAMARAGLWEEATARDVAYEAADFLIWAQQQAGAGCFPFPAAKHTSDAKAMQVATRFIEAAERKGILDQTVRNGWAFADHGDGGLQFDNAECGLAIFELYEWSKETKYLEAAKLAADWSMTQPLCPNWNYNSFSVELLAKAYSVTKEPRYLDASVKKATLGVLPGQLTEGPHAGRWFDPHNARPAYHYIMLRALSQLIAVLPIEHVDRELIKKRLILGFKTRNEEMVTRGIMTKDVSLECLLFAQYTFSNDGNFLDVTSTASALNSLSRLVTVQLRQNKVPVGPKAFGEWLAYLARNHHEP